MLKNLRLALRSLAKARGFTLVAILTLAVGIGSTTAIYSALHALVIQPFQFHQAEQLVHVWSGDSWSLSPADSIDLRAQSKSFSAFGVYQPTTVNVGLTHAQSCVAVRSTADVLRAFGVQPLYGRLFNSADDAVGAAPVAVLSHAFWQQHFAGDPLAIGTKLHIEGVDTMVVGVMPKTFEFVSPWLRTESCELWLPFPFDETKRKMRDSHFLLGLARLKPGVTVGAADAEIKSIGVRLAKLYPDADTGKPFLVRSLYIEMTKMLSKQVWMLFAAVGLVLLVACANVASMLLARSAKRQSEFGVRVALGASGRQMMQLVLLESLLLAVAGCIVGVVFAYWGVEILRAISPISETRKAAMQLNIGALTFALGASLLTALLAGFSPALAAMRTPLGVVLHADARGSVGSLARHRLLRGLIIAQVAVAFVLANGAVLFAQGYMKLMEENQRLVTDQVISARVALSSPRYHDDASKVRFWYELVQHIQGVSSVTSAAVTSKLPLGGASNTSALVNNETYDPTIQRLQVERSSITENYFNTMGLRLLQGRNLQAEDRIGDVRGVVVNQEMVARAWPNKNPLGEIMRGNNPGKPWYTVRVVGVVENVKQWGADQPVQPEMYTTAEGNWGDSAFLVVKTSLPVDQLTPLLRHELTAIDPELAFRDIYTMRQIVSQSTQAHRALAGLVNFFMVIALGLVAVGLYGTLSYHVQQRTREIGVRVAIGAMKRDIFRLVFAQGGRWIVIGVGLGLLGSLAVAKVLKTIVYGMTDVSPALLGFAGIAVALAAFVACWLPAYRAARLNPLEALRAD